MPAIDEFGGYSSRLRIPEMIGGASPANKSEKEMAKNELQKNKRQKNRMND